MEIKIDKNTLPKNGQKIQWQTQEDQDQDYNKWKTGVYLDDDGYGLFLYNVKEDGSTSHWDLMFDVLKWEPL